MSMHPVEGFAYFGVALWVLVIPSHPFLAVFLFHAAAFGDIPEHALDAGDAVFGVDRQDLAQQGLSAFVGITVQPRAGGLRRARPGQNLATHRTGPSLA